MKNIIVVCTGNTCRSPMAEGIIKNIIANQGKTDINVSSMGLCAYDDEPASEYAIEVMDEVGIDIKSHLTRCLMKKDLLDADVIYAMTLQHRDVIIEACSEVEDKIIVADVKDPFGMTSQQYRECRDYMIEFFGKENF